MLKIPDRKSILSTRTPHVPNIERPNARRRREILKQQYIMPKRPTRSEEIAKVTAELNDRVISLQMQVADWKAMKKSQ